MVYEPNEETIGKHLRGLSDRELEMYKNGMEKCSTEVPEEIEQYSFQLSDMIRAERIREALKKLQDPNLDIEEIARILGWDESKGPAVGVWKNKDGHSTLWGTKWATRHGLKTPKEFLGNYLLSFEQQVAEVSDIYRRTMDAITKQAASDALNVAYTTGKSKCAQLALLKALELGRSNYYEYILPWSPPARILVRRYRPGWDPADVGDLLKGWT